MHTWLGRTGPAWITAAGLAATLGTLVPLAAAQRSADRGLEVIQLRDDFHMIAGAGANILVQVGPDGVTLVDSGSGERSAAVLEAIRGLTPLPIRYVINTSMDLDHTGGNAELTRAGLSILPGALAAGSGLGDALVSNEGAASVLAHENVLRRMTQSANTDAPVPFALWPTKTFFYHQYAMYLNGEGIQVIHQPNAHTDGDAIVFFRRGDVIATGDVIDTTRFPFIDVSRGGSIKGELAALNRLMDMSILNVPLQWVHERTFLVPGHGRVYDKLDLLEYRDAMTIVRDRIEYLLGEGRSLEQVKAANPTLGYRSQYGTDSGPWTTDMFVEAIYRELAAEKEATE
jgi:glyoxylase-like metal-dependent hydrolase (beta-lactamase superfamily II)